LLDKELPMNPTISALRWVPSFAQGYVRDHRVRWALEEIDCRYEVALVERQILDSPAYRAWQPFGQVPAFRDEKTELFESGAIALYIAKISEVLAPQDEAGFARVTGWVIAALNSVEPHVQNFTNLDAFYAGQPWVEAYRPIAKRNLRVKLEALGIWLAGRDYLENRFTVADVVMSTVLRELRESGILAEFPVVASYLDRCERAPPSGAPSRRSARITVRMLRLDRSANAACSARTSGLEH
jgi:glutathione S-transferase